MFISLADLYFFFPCFNENDLSINKITKCNTCTIITYCANSTKPNLFWSCFWESTYVVSIYDVQLFCNFISDIISRRPARSLLTRLRCFIFRDTVYFCISNYSKQNQHVGPSLSSIPFWRCHLSRSPSKFY